MPRCGRQTHESDRNLLLNNYFNRSDHHPAGESTPTQWPSPHTTLPQELHHGTNQRDHLITPSGSTIISVSTSRPSSQSATKSRDILHPILSSEILQDEDDARLPALTTTSGQLSTCGTTHASRTSRTRARNHNHKAIRGECFDIATATTRRFLPERHCTLERGRWRHRLFANNCETTTHVIRSPATMIFEITVKSMIYPTHNSGQRSQPPEDTRDSQGRRDQESQGGVQEGCWETNPTCCRVVRGTSSPTTPVGGAMIASRHTSISPRSKRSTIVSCSRLQLASSAIGVGPTHDVGSGSAFAVVLTITSIKLLVPEEKLGVRGRVRGLGGDSHEAGRWVQYPSRTPEMLNVE